MPNETDQAYVRFRDFLHSDAPTITAYGRRMEAVGECSPHTIRVLAAKHRWRERRRYYWARQNREELDGLKEAARDIAKEHMVVWTDIMQMAMEAFQYHHAKGSKIKVRDALAMAKAATEFQRLVNGDSTSNTKFDFGSAATDESLREMQALVKAARKEHEK